MIELTLIAFFACGYALGRFEKSKAVSRAYDNGWRQCRQLNEQVSEAKEELYFYRPTHK